jgi:type II secretion system protein N
MDLPRVKLGNLEASVKFDKGTGTVEKLSTKGGDLELGVSGTVKLAKLLSYSEANLHVKLKPQPELLKNGFIGMGISALPTDPSNPSFHTARVTGYLGSPAFNPGM